MTRVRAWAAPAAGQALEAYDYDPGPLPDDQVEIAVEHCGVCHSDLSMIDNAWQFTTYPLVPGHEAVGRIVYPAAAQGPASGRSRAGARRKTGSHGKTAGHPRQSHVVFC